MKYQPPTFVDELIPIRSGSFQGGGAIPGNGKKQRDASLGSVDAVDGDLVIDGDKPLPTAVEGRT